VLTLLQPALQLAKAISAIENVQVDERAGTTLETAQTTLDQANLLYT